MKILLLILTLSTFLSCTDDQDDIRPTEQQRPSPVESVEAPSTAQVGQAVEVVVNFRVFNGCGQFDRFAQEVTGTTRTIEVQAVYRGEICTQDVPLRTTTYTFTPEEKGLHSLRFHAGEAQFEVVQIQVE